MIRRWGALIGVGLAIGVLAGCAPARLRSSVAGPGWSRGIVLGDSSFNDLVGLYPEPDGGRVHVAWGRVTAEGEHIRYVQLDGSGKVVQDRPLRLAVRSPRQVSLLPDGEGGMIVCYLSGLGTGRRLCVAHLDGMGGVLSPPEAVSGDEREADSYVVVPVATGLEVFWSNNDSERRGLYHLRLDATGRPVVPSQLLVDRGMRPSAQVAANGTLHLAWLFEPGYYEEAIYYAPFDPASRRLGPSTRLADFPLNPRAVLYGPALALSRDRATVLWSWEQLAASADRATGAGQCSYASFAPGAAAAAQVQSLELPATPRPAYQPAQGAFAYTQLAVVGEGALSLGRMPGAVRGEGDEAAVAVAFQTYTRTSSRVQVGVVYLAAGAVKGYQIAGRTSSVLIRPVLDADDRGQLHLAWLEPAGFRSYRVYYAATAPAVREALGRFGRDDVVAGAYGLAWALARSASMFPIALIWLFVPFVWVMAYYIARPDGELQRRGRRLALAVAIVLYAFAKFFVMPSDFLGAAPLLDRLPTALGDAYMMALPVAILMAALGALWVYARRNESPTLFFGFLVFGATDCALTFLLYGPGVFGD